MSLDPGSTLFPGTSVFPSSGTTSGTLFPGPTIFPGFNLFPGTGYANISDPSIWRNLVINPSGEQSYHRAWTASNGTVETNVDWEI